MRYFRTLAALTACAAFMAIPACSKTVDGVAIKKSGAEKWETATTTTPPYSPPQQRTSGLSVEVITAAQTIGGFWRNLNVDLGDVPVLAAYDLNGVPCLPDQDPAIVNTWICGGTNTIVANMAVIEYNMSKFRTNTGLIWLFIGYSFGQILVHTQNLAVNDVDSLSLCLAGASTAGVGKARETLDAAFRVYDASPRQLQAVQLGTITSPSTCIDTVR